MDIFEIRLARLRELEKEAGGRAALAERLGMAYSLLSSYIGKNPTKNIGEKTARTAEKVFDKPWGWMDAVSEEDEPPNKLLAETRKANLKQLVDELANGNVTGFGRLCGKSQPLLSDLLAGRKSFGEKQAASIEQTINLEPGWLSRPGPHKIHFKRETLSDLPGFEQAARHEVIEYDDGAEVERRYHERRIAERRYTETIEIKYLNVAGSMGAGLTIPDHDHSVSSFSVDLTWLRNNVSFTAPQNLCLIDGRGDSMTPTFNDGDVLVVDRGVNRADVDAVYVLTRDGELYIKRLQRLGQDTFLMISDNPVYRPVEIKINGSSDFRVLARVVWAWNGKKL